MGISSKTSPRNFVDVDKKVQDWLTAFCCQIADKDQLSNFIVAGMNRLIHDIDRND